MDNDRLVEIEHILVDSGVLNYDLAFEIILELRDCKRELNSLVKTVKVITRETMTLSDSIKSGMLDLRDGLETRIQVWDLQN